MRKNVEALHGINHLFLENASKLLKGIIFCLQLSFVCPVKTKFGIPDAAMLRFVLDSDGCEVDAADIAELADTKEAQMCFVKISSGQR
jgi:hypothetical protein